MMMMTLIMMVMMIMTMMMVKIVQESVDNTCVLGSDGIDGDYDN